jgi:hypothetical protein
MTTMTLFDMAAQVRASFQVDETTGEINEDYIHSIDLFREKGVACVAYLKDEDAHIEAQEKMLAQMATHIKARKARLERFKDYIQASMLEAGVECIASADGLFYAKLERDRDISVEIDAGAVIPVEFCLEPKPPAPSKALLRKAIEAGQPVPAGVRLVRKHRLIIK